MLMRLLQRPGWMAADRLGLHNPRRIYFWGQYGRRGVAEPSERASEPCHIRHVGLWVCAAGYGRFVVAINMANVRGRLRIKKKFQVLKYSQDYRANVNYPSRLVQNSLLGRQFLHPAYTSLTNTPYKLLYWVPITSLPIQIYIHTFQYANLLESNNVPSLAKGQKGRNDGGWWFWEQQEGYVHREVCLKYSRLKQVR